MSESSSFRWYALYVKSRHEKTVHAQLLGKQQEAFLPLYSAKHKWADRFKTVSLPLFPGYVFCRFDSTLRSKVLATSGVIDVVRVGSEPAPIPNSEIESVQLILTSRLRVEPYAHLSAGQAVVMTGGPLAGLTGTLTSIRNNLRLVVSVELLCRSVLVEITHEWVAPRQGTDSARDHRSNEDFKIA